MDSLSSIKSSIKSISGGVVSLGPIFNAKVKSVDGETCSVDLDGMELTDVRLRAVVNGENSKILVTPKIGSHVLVADLCRGDMRETAVLGYSEVDKIEIDCADKIVINGGHNDGLVKIGPLVDRLNYIERKIGALMDIFYDWVPLPQDGGTALKTTLAEWCVGQIELSRRENLENDKIKH